MGGGPAGGRSFPKQILANPYVWIFAGGLLLRLIYLADALRRNELIAYPVVDAQSYVEWAWNILAGKLLWYDVSNYTPGFPAWLAFWIGLLGWHPAVHFAVFHTLGAAQAVLVGKMAEILWERRIGIVTGWLAATYWPFIVFEGTYFAEAFAILNLTLALFLTARWTRAGGGVGWLVWAGFHLGFSILARANAFVCAFVLAGWVVWSVLSNRSLGGDHPRRRAVAAAGAILLPPLLLCVPILMWNWKLTGRAVLRSEGWLSIYVGNNPEYGALAVPVGVRWTDLIYKPIHAGKTQASEKDDYWHDEVRNIMREQTGNWMRLQVRKALMETGAFEVSQEIDIGIYRAASRVLSLPVWPGWGVVVPVAAIAIVAMCRPSSAQRGLPLLLCGAAYFASIFPVQVAARYRLPTVITLLPLAGWSVIWLLDRMRRREWSGAAQGALIIAVAGLLVWPDWTGVRRQKIVNQWFLIGMKRADAGDENGALAAFEQGSEWNPADADCPLRSGRIWLHRGNTAKAMTYFKKSHDNFPRGHESVLGYGECALAENHPMEALRSAIYALKIAPNNLDALDLASRASAARGDWVAVAKICRQMSSYPTHPASAAFTEAWAWIHAGSAPEALRVYEGIAATPWFAPLDRARAAFLAGAITMRLGRDKAEAIQHWQAILKESPTFFTPLAELLTGAKTAHDIQANAPADLYGKGREYFLYAEGLAAAMDGHATEAREYFENVIAVRKARTLAPGDQDVIEIWSMADTAGSTSPGNDPAAPGVKARR
jgi:tetratricopeptide (TPR) repeat protein